MIQSRVSDRFVDAVQMFGDESYAVVPSASEFAGTEQIAVPIGLNDIVFQSLCIALLFCIALYMRYRFELRVLLNGMIRSFAEDFETNRKLTALTNGFFRTAALTGMLSITVMAVKFSEFWFPELPQVDARYTTLAAAICVIVAVVAVVLYEYLLLRMIGVVSGRGDFIDTLLYVKQACFSIIALFLSPAVLLSALSADMNPGWLYFIAIECVILSFLFLKETFVLFIRKKIPIFQLILYLCTVEAFPLTLICASIARFR